jgi:hypothetical protein
VSSLACPSNSLTRGLKIYLICASVNSTNLGLLHTAVIVLLSSDLLAILLKTISSKESSSQILRRLNRALHDLYDSFSNWDITIKA